MERVFDRNLDSDNVGLQLLKNYRDNSDTPAGSNTGKVENDMHEGGFPRIQDILAIRTSTLKAPARTQAVTPLVSTSWRRNPKKQIPLALLRISIATENSTDLGRCSNIKLKMHCSTNLAKTRVGYPENDASSHIFYRIDAWHDPGIGDEIRQPCMVNFYEI
ncbi:hypothetical protein EAF00_002907 [Botryotinia globosa]|nr:hypothetical protein EAF00_002907 [Botryotinia globosa]